MRRLAFFALLVTSSTSFGQWTDIQRLGDGGEAFLSTDGKGAVYATSHLPCKLYVSHDYGKTFGIKHDLPESFCDVNTAVGPDGRLYVVYIKPGVAGLQVVTSADRGKTIEKAGALNGPYDREWIVVNPVTGDVGYNYSDGYIGGPKSKGIFYAASSDQGKTFQTVSRVDKEPQGRYAVDPYLTVGTGGRLYAAWAVSTDYNTVDSYMFAASDDGGKTWKNHATICDVKKGFGDTQERWMLGSVVAAGKDTVMAIYMDYQSFDVDGEEMRPLLTFYKVSHDGGATWSPGKPCLQPKEIIEAMRMFRKTGNPRSSVPNYMQTLPWVCSDPAGRIHLAFEDNRSGQTTANGKMVGKWHVRLATWERSKLGFGPSERVSHDWAAERPPLDFIGCCADAENVWVIWTENPNKTSGWDFTGELYLGRKSLPKPAPATLAGVLEGIGITG